MLKIISKLKKNELVKSDISLVAILFIALLFAVIIPAGIFNDGERDVYGYTTSSRGGGSVAFRITKEDKSDLQERLEDIREKTEELMDVMEKKEQKSSITVTIPVTETKEEYITEYIAYGANNNKEEVEKLQIFLNRHMGENIPITGFYGDITLNAVKRFQQKYASEILHPWGINEPTGYVYKTTQRMINVIETGKNIPMPLVSQASTPTTRTVEPRTQDISREIEATDGAEDLQEEKIWGISEEGVEDGEIVVVEGIDREEEDDKEEEKEGQGSLVEWILIVIGTTGIVIIVFTIRSFRVPNRNLSS